MPAFFEFSGSEDLIPVHVLIVVVGKYASSSRNLKGAGQFAQDILNFWQSKDRIFPFGQRLASAEVLVTDPDAAVHILSAGRQGKPEAPSFQSVKTAMTGWADRIRARDGAVGVLHWVGHGFETTANGEATVLACEGTLSDDETQDGLSWSGALHWINGRTEGHPVYCFIDACRTLKTQPGFYEGLGNCPLQMSDNAVVFQSTQPNKKAFWITSVSEAAGRSGCRPHGLGTRAFLEALDSFGARPGVQSDGSVPVTSSALIEAAHHLMARWSRHQDLKAAGQPRSSKTSTTPMLFTNRPKSIVEVRVSRDKETRFCLSRSASAKSHLVAETDRAPFEFRLSRKPHSFKLGDGRWGPELGLEYPYVPIDDGVEVLDA